MNIDTNHFSSGQFSTGHFADTFASTLAQTLSAVDWTELLHSTLLKEALLTAAFAGWLCGGIGPLVVWKRLSLVGDAISHSSFAAVALGLLAGWSATSVLVPFAILLALALAWMEEKSVFENDAVLAVFFSGLFALGVICVSVLHHTSQDLIHLLLGNILTVTHGDMLQLAFTTVLVGGYLISQRNTLILMILQPDLAAVEGLPVRRNQYLLMAAIGLTIAVCLKLMGVILLTSLLTVPSLVARSLGGSLRRQWLLSIGIATLLALAGVLVSFVLDIPTGPTIGALGFLVFLFSVALRSLFFKAV